MFKVLTVGFFLVSQVKTRLQKQTKGPDGKMPYKGSIDCALKVVKEEGFLRFYRGFGT